MRPVIAVTCDRRAQGPKVPGSGRIRPPRPEVFLHQSVVDALRGYGAEPLLVPPHGGPSAAQKWLVKWLVKHCNAVVITGGAFDIHPSHYGQQVDSALGRVDEGRTGLELAMARAAIQADIPILGICGGMQAMAVASGGTLLQDIRTARPQALDHEQPTDPATAHHPVILGLSPLLDIYTQPEILVNSTHHQAVDDPGQFEVVGTSPDGIAEAIVHPHRRFCIGVQWHPELVDPAPLGALVRAASG